MTFKIASAALVAGALFCSTSVSGAMALPMQNTGNPKAGQLIGKLYVPRYSKKYVRLIAEGTAASVLNGPGLGHYTGTQWAGQVGNFAIAGHRTANGGPMLKIDKLHAGDQAFVKTDTGWYTYTWVATKIVKPTDVSVVYPVPKEMPGAVEGGSYMTFTSCTPIHVNTHRIVAWFQLTSSSSLSDGPPPELGLSK